jgi:hypothetical protein
MPGEDHIFLKNGSHKFLPAGLDRANQIEFAEENCGFGATIFATRAVGITALSQRRTPRRSPRSAELIELDQ